MICMSLSDGWLWPEHELSYVIPLIIGWLRPYLGFIMILFDGWLRPCLDPFTLSFYGWLHPCHDSCIIWQRSQFMYMYLYLLAGFPTADRFPALIYKAFHPSLWLDLHALGGIYYIAFYHYPILPIPWSWRTSTVNPACFAFMERLPLCPSSWADHFPFAPFPLKLMFFPIYKTDANDLCLPHADVQRLALLPVPIGATALCSSHASPIMESFLN